MAATDRIKTEGSRLSTITTYTRTQETPGTNWATLQKDKGARKQHNKYKNKISSSWLSLKIIKFLSISLGLINKAFVCLILHKIILMKMPSFAYIMRMRSNWTQALKNY